MFITYKGSLTKRYAWQVTNTIYYSSFQMFMLSFIFISAYMLSSKNVSYKAYTLIIIYVFKIKFWIVIKDD